MIDHFKYWWGLIAANGPVLYRLYYLYATCTMPTSCWQCQVHIGKGMHTPHTHTHTTHTLHIHTSHIHMTKLYGLKQNNLRLVICVTISLTLGWRKNTWARRVKLICHHAKQSDIAIQYTRRRLFCFYILLFNGFKSFQADINMYLLLYFIFVNHRVGIHPIATQNSHEQHSNAIYVMSWWLMIS